MADWNLMVNYLTRAEWGGRPAHAGPGHLTPSRVKGVALHWPGTESDTPIRTEAAVASALRGWQAYHMAAPPVGRGWSDMAYQVAVDQAGRAWLLRGLSTQSGANGDATVNEEYGAILLVLVQGEKPSPAMKATVRAVIEDFRALYPHATRVVGHGDIRPNGGTDCPGPAAKAAIAAGDFTPGNDPETPEEELFTVGQYENLMQQIKNEGSATRQEVRRQAIWATRYGVQTEDEKAAADHAFDAVIDAGGTLKDALAAAAAVMKPIDDDLAKRAAENG